MKKLTLQSKSNNLLVKCQTLLNIAGKSLIVLAFVSFFAGCSKPELQQDIEKDQQSELSLKSAGDFTIAVIPDIQNYMSGYFNGTEAMFTSQINWIKNNKAAQNIVYVAGLGDITEHGDDAPAEWVKAKNGFYSLESSSIPYGLAVGNHDGTPFNGHILSLNTNQYETYFGVTHFNNPTKFPHWKGHYGSDNNSHYDFFSAGGVDFMCIYMEYDHYYEDTLNMNTWAYNLLVTNPSRKAIVVTHYVTQIGDPAPWGIQARGIYNKLKSRPNFFMMLGGHVAGPSPDYVGEGYREDTSGGRTVRTYLSDYQQRPAGGNGYMRLMKFSVVNDDVTVKTYSPYVNAYETDINSQFTKPLFGAAPTVQVANGRYKVIAKHSGKTIVVKDASMLGGASIVQYYYTPTTPNDEWDLTYQSNGYYRIVNGLSALDMNVQGGSTAVGGLVVQWPYNPATPRSFEWGLIPVGGGYYKIIARNSGLCLNVAGGGNNDGALIKQWTYIGDDGVDNDKFRLELVP